MAARKIAPPTPDPGPPPAFPHPFRGYRVTREDGCEAEVRASVGCFFPYDPQTVAFYCRDPEIARRVRRRWPRQVQVFAQGDDEVTFHLPSKLYPEVAAAAGLLRRSAHSVMIDT